jgi:hypothetical protein
VFLRASAATEIPVELLLAISHVESGFHPHAINMSGQSYFPWSRNEALRLLVRSGDNVDIGLSPTSWILNSTCWSGAKILQHCVRVNGSWWKGIATYHSPRDLRQREYVNKVWQSYRRVLIEMRK